MSAILILTLFHVLMNVVAIVAGAGLIRRLIANGDDRSLAHWFLTTIAATLCARAGVDWRASGGLSMWRVSRS